MPRKPETRFRAKFEGYLWLIPKSWWESVQQKAIKGTPDKIGCVNSVFCGLELKRSIKAPVTPLQVHKLNLIRMAGGYSNLVYPENMEEVLGHLKLISQQGASCLPSLGLKLIQLPSSVALSS